MARKNAGKNAEDPSALDQSFGEAQSKSSSIADPELGSAPEIAVIKSGSGTETNGLSDVSKGSLRAHAVSPGLHVVATPIGNAADITLRALQTLNAAHVIACEDTRITRKLLSIHGIGTPMLAYHEHNADKAKPLIMERLKRGETVALVSDAGTPLISDPGYKLIRDCVAENLSVTTEPGPSSVMAALVLAGLPTDRFMFAGFLPQKHKARCDVLSELGDIQTTLVFLESPKRLAASLADMAACLGPRPAAVTRELTKLYEEVRRDTLDVLAAHYAEAGSPKGEITIVIGPPETKLAFADDDAVSELLTTALENQSVRDAAASVAVATGRKKRDVYALAVKLNSERP